MVARQLVGRRALRLAPGVALCETAVGLADRSDLGKLELRGASASSSSSAS